MSRSLIPNEFMKILRKEKYQLVGRHSAVKKCWWLHKSLLGEEGCYKNKFYGIKSWQCLQMTPAVVHCTMRCLFCWRIQSGDIAVNFDETAMKAWDDPSIIVDKAVEAQRRILTGYKVHSKVLPERYSEALEPRHAAISLAGEPTLYPDLDGLVHEFHSRGFSTFIVTNGTVPEALGKITEEPSQLYVSLCAPDKGLFMQICRPQISSAWEKLNQTLDLLSSFSCPTVVRLTLVRHYNLKELEKYAQLVKRTNPTYVEAKAYVYVGMSRQRLNFENMPTHIEIKAFAEKLSDLSGYKVLDESKPSRVVLLSRVGEVVRFT